MNNNLTELVLILDKSGSMAGLESDTIGGYNGMMTKQRAESGECLVTTVLFDHQYYLLHDRINLKALGEMTAREYQVGGSTALLDALGRSINKLINVQRSTLEAYQAGKVIFVIITDGQENASRLFNQQQIKALISHQQEKYGWEFIFLGANMDAVETAAHFGIAADRAASYLADGEGTELNFQMMNEALRAFRRTGRVDEQAIERIRQDHRGRGGRN